MASTIKVDKLDPQSGTALEIGTSGDTVTVPSGVGLTLTDSTLLLPTTITSTTEVKTNKISPATGTAFALGDSGDTFTVPSGATIANNGTATGFGGDNTPAFLAFASAAQTFSDDTLTKIVFSTESYDTDNTFATSRFTHSGTSAYYSFYSSIALEQNNTGIEIIVQFHKDGSEITNTQLTHTGELLQSDKPQTVTTAITILMADTEYLEVFGKWNGGGSTVSVDYSATIFKTFFGGFKIIT